MLRKSLCGVLATGVLVAAAGNAVADNRVSVSKKGSLLVYPDIELRWNSSGKLIQNTFLTIVNDYPQDVFVQWYFINGDVPLDAVLAGDPPVQVERSHTGWNWIDCTIHLTQNESTWYDGSNGLPMGCQPFATLDQGSPAGRPDTDGLTSNRVLRGYAIAFAVDNNGNEISFNHLSGGTEIVNYANTSAWEFGAYAFQAINPTVGAPTDAFPGVLNLDGVEYDYSFAQLLLDFFYVGSTAMSSGGTSVMLDTDLTLMPLDMDLRQDNDGPVTTKAKFDIWDENENSYSGTTRCVTHWDQTLLSQWNIPNQFLKSVSNVDKGKARIDGIQSTVCDYLDFGFDEYGWGNWDWKHEQSQNSSLLGVANRILAFSGGFTGRTDSAETLVGQGTQAAQIKHDIFVPPSTLIDGSVDSVTTPTPGRIEEVGSQGVSTLKDASQRPTGR